MKNKGRGGDAAIFAHTPHRIHLRPKLKASSLGDQMRIRSGWVLRSIVWSSDDSGSDES